MYFGLHSSLNQFHTTKPVNNTIPISLCIRFRIVIVNRFE